ncbi:hypothetical protein GWI33_021957 [Rhynchophorus ferrugineus]|uniref:Uncharacterized protein n=1 Tax=Rhynchophorus ferrugineus TaxID=354439 RepID=A0A834J0U1_RHYFE|nr:hypothetical protein GWI33_021957 [Rhynchophorus ferrugineus]
MNKTLLSTSSWGWPLFSPVPVCTVRILIKLGAVCAGPGWTVCKKGGPQLFGDPSWQNYILVYAADPAFRLPGPRRSRRVECQPTSGGGGEGVWSARPPPLPPGFGDPGVSPREINGENYGEGIAIMADCTTMAML